MKVDIEGTGNFNIQCKHVEKLGSRHEILKSMPANGFNLLFHKINRSGDIVCMLKDDFYKLIKDTRYGIE